MQIIVVAENTIQLTVVMTNGNTGGSTGYQHPTLTTAHTGGLTGYQHPTLTTAHTGLKQVTNILP